MEKQKNWQFYLIVAVIALTLYNILPTVFYYTKPLRSPVNQELAEEVSSSIIERVNSLEDQSKDWLYSFAKLLQIKPKSIETDPKAPGLIEVAFNSPKEAARFKQFLPKAGALIPFVPAQLQLYPDQREAPQSVFVQREIDVRFRPEENNALFHFIPKKEGEEFSKGYQELVKDQTLSLLLNLGGPNINGKRVEAVLKEKNSSDTDQTLQQVALNLSDFSKTFSKSPALVKRYIESYAQIGKAGSENIGQQLKQQMTALRDRLNQQKEKIVAEQKKLQSEKAALDPAQEIQLSSLESELSSLNQALSLLKDQPTLLAKTTAPLTEAEAEALFTQTLGGKNAADGLQVISLKGKHPFIESLIVSWNSDIITLKLYDDVQKLRELETSSEANAYLQNKINQYVINDLAAVARTADETLIPADNGFSVQLFALPNAESFLKFDLSGLAAMQLKDIQAQLNAGFSPISKDLTAEAYPVRDYATYQKQPAEDRKFGLVLYSPAMSKESAPEGFTTSSIYVVAKGMQSILQKAQSTAQTEETAQLAKDLEQLRLLMEGMNFIVYPGSSYGIAPEYANDLIFAKPDYYSNILKASREAFEVKGSKRYAYLPFTDVEQRILTQNKIDDVTQEDLLRSIETYSAAQVDPDPAARFLVPAPTQNPYWSNFKINLAKYFRGDDRKILKWGLDLSGGKTVRIGLRDSNNMAVTNPQDIKQAVNELYTRINKMGVAERTIRVENNNIILEFPGSQALSASDLVKASAMYFHIVNEKFSTANPALGGAVNQFLKNVWNEAVVTNRKDIESVKEIAWRHLGGESLKQENPRPMSEEARILYENGLRLADPKTDRSTNTFNDTFSTIAMMRGEDFMEWDGQPHPLLIIFNNYALEGSSLTGIHVGYDSSQGNNLSFSVKRSYDNAERTGSPRDDFFAWTSQFAEDRIAGTPKESYSQGRGWRMAVILNGSVISKPTLNAALRESATITGRFTQREVDQLAADLKAGSLSFTPKILSEQNVSAELGSEERFKGIAASIVALALVVIAMCGYYRFAGVVASCAVLLNILIMWGVLQNLGAALTLPAIAGIVLTIGMAVDANVLVFERIREEFAISGRIASAIQAGYRKAFSAIVDSNITTILAALILIQFDSGPIKGFAVTLIVGIISSMFTSLFMTRYYFAGWVQNPQHKSLPMAQFFGKTHFDFLKFSKPIIIGSALLMLVGGYMLFDQRNTILGMDFTGGYALNVELTPSQDPENYRIKAHDALLAQGASPRDVQIRELTKPNQLMIQLGTGMEEKGQPFFNLPTVLEEGKFAFEYQKNPRLEWVVQSLEKGGLKISTYELQGIDNNWTVMSGQFSDAMRNNAMLALGLALLSILIYITFRFEFKYAAAAVIGLAHDVVITLGVFAIFHALGFLVQIDLQVIGAIMTIIGYSLNDTIIVFDRIREDIRLMRKSTYSDIINHALNVTLSRTVMTSGTTLLVLLTLVLMGGQSIFAFSLVMTVGVLVGTFSSLFIASPMLLFLHNREVAQEQEDAKLKRT